MNKMLCANVEKCTGCKMCQLACSMKNFGEYNPDKSRIRVFNFQEEAYSVPVVCKQCNDAWCAKICPAGAITVKVDKDNEYKAVVVDKESCTGCNMCVESCPFGNIRPDEEGYADKCELCGGDPECVKVCLRGALKFKEIEYSAEQKMKSTAEKILAAYKK